MTTLQVKLLGNFRIIQNGTDIVRALGGSKKKIALLEYLILQWNRPVPAPELFETIWPLEDNTNPENALKTLVSRLRKDLSAYDAADLVATRAGAYMWNTEADCDIDLHEFESLCVELLSCPALDDEARAKFSRMLGLYEGDLMTNSDKESWVVSRSVYYHDLYLKTIYRYIELLRGEKAYETICDVCRTALAIDAFDSVLSLELTGALTMLGKRRDAASQYDYASDLRYTQYGGERSPEEVRQLYQRILADRREADAGISDILADLTSANTIAQGAFVCDYAIFRDIYQLNMRNLQRLNIPVFVALTTLNCADDRAVEPLVLHKVMGELQEIMRTSLRCGDTVSRYSPNQFALLLPAVNFDTGKLVLERIKKQFYQQNPSARFVFNYRLVPVESDKQNEK
ncbi:MAG: winged helix-turn-helix domain-containing protein [Oscillospiraceae bacterium]|nr:winged helix-turn-helix domain-containing protein [Oscillospiraceae bacterium]